MSETIKGLDKLLQKYGSLEAAAEHGVFQSTPSSRKATVGVGGRRYEAKTFQSTPSSRKATAVNRNAAAQR